MNPCVIIPHFEHAAALAGVLRGLEPLGLPCIVVDDGSSTTTQSKLTELEETRPWVTVVRREQNGGKGAALKTGYRNAAAKGYSHALQVDADGQHDLSDAPAFLEAMRTDQEAFVLGVPVFDESVPRARLYGRQLSIGIVWLLTLARTVPDPLCGFRGVPLAAALRVLDQAATGDRMDFDPEFAVRMVWSGVPVIAIPTSVQYLPDGVSHFRMVEDNLALASVYVRLLGGTLARLPKLLFGVGQRADSW